MGNLYSQLAKCGPIKVFPSDLCVQIEERKGNTMHALDDETTEAPADVHELNANDRCDICGAQAYVRVELATGELIFCSHHGNEQRAKLEAIALSWHDETEKLLAR